MRKKIKKIKEEKRRPNIKYKLIRLKKILRAKTIEEISQVDDRDPFESGVDKI